MRYGRWFKIKYSIDPDNNIDYTRCKVLKTHGLYYEIGPWFTSKYVG